MENISVAQPQPLTIEEHIEFVKKSSMPYQIVLENTADEVRENVQLLLNNIDDKKENYQNRKYIDNGVIISGANKNASYEYLINQLVNLGFEIACITIETRECDKLHGDSLIIGGVDLIPIEKTDNGISITDYQFKDASRVSLNGENCILISEVPPHSKYLIRLYPAIFEIAPANLPRKLNAAIVNNTDEVIKNYKIIHNHALPLIFDKTIFEFENSDAPLFFDATTVYEGDNGDMISKPLALDVRIGKNKLQSNSKYRLDDYSYLLITEIPARSKINVELYVNSFGEVGQQKFPKTNPYLFLINNTSSEDVNNLTLLDAYSLFNVNKQHEWVNDLVIREGVIVSTVKSEHIDYRRFLYYLLSNKIEVAAFVLEFLNGSDIARGLGDRENHMKDIKVKYNNIDGSIGENSAVLYKSKLQPTIYYNTVHGIILNNETSLIIDAIPANTQYILRIYPKEEIQNQTSKPYIIGL